MKNKLLKIMFVLSAIVLVSCLEQKKDDSEGETETPSTNPTPSPTPVANQGCDSTITGSVGLAFSVSPTQEIIPLCDGDVVYQNQASNEIGLVNLINSTLKNSWQLTAKPTHMVLDSDAKYLYVAMDSLAKIAKIDVTNLSSSNVTYMNLSAAASWLALGNNGVLFANLTASGSYWGNIDLVNVTTEQKIKTLSGSFAKIMVFNTLLNELVTGTQGLSPAAMTRYSFDTVNQTLTQAESLSNAGSNGQYMTLSPNSQHLIFNTGTGNAASYGLVDYTPGSFSATQGSWAVGAYPMAAAFSPDNKYVLTTTTSQLKIFNVDTHAVYLQSSPDLTSCSYSSISRVGFSRGGKLAYAYSYCGFNKDSGILILTTW